MNEVLEALARGAVVGVPTDTVYGLAADPEHEKAVDELFRLKGRRESAPVVVLAASLEQARALIDLDDTALAIAGPHWPGALTVVARAVGVLSRGIGDPERGTLGVRVPDHDDLRRLLELFGPLAVTSANRSGAPPAVDHEQARSIFGAAVPVYVPGVCRAGSASTVVDVTHDAPRVLRPGPVVIDAG